MRDQLISFETAKLAKEKGCPLTSIWYFDVEQNNKCCYGSSDGYGQQQFSKKDKAFYAFTQSLLQKWLRDIYNIHIIIHPHYNAIFEKHTYIMRTTKYGNFIAQDSETSFHDTYEGALEHGLEIGLNKI